MIVSFIFNTHVDLYLWPVIKEIVIKFRSATMCLPQRFVLRFWVAAILFLLTVSDNSVVNVEFL